MGEQDLNHLYPIYSYLQKRYPAFGWQMDSGHYETRIAIEKETGKLITDISDQTLHILGCDMFVPDIFSYGEKVAIEFQEQPKRKKHIGRLSKKGHTEFSDEIKEDAYKSAGIKQIKIWDDDIDWRRTIDTKLAEFGY